MHNLSLVLYSYQAQITGHTILNFENIPANSSPLHLSQSLRLLHALTILGRWSLCLVKVIEHGLLSHCEPNCVWLLIRLDNETKQK